MFYPNILDRIDALLSLLERYVVVQEESFIHGKMMYKDGYDARQAQEQQRRIEWEQVEQRLRSENEQRLMLHEDHIKALEGLLKKMAGYGEQ